MASNRKAVEIYWEKETGVATFQESKQMMAYLKRNPVAFMDFQGAVARYARDLTQSAAQEMENLVKEEKP